MYKDKLTRKLEEIYQQLDESNVMLSVAEQVAKAVNKALGANAVTAERNAIPKTWSRGDGMRHRDASVVINSYANAHREDIQRLSRRLDDTSGMDQEDIDFYTQELKDSKKRFNDAKKYEESALKAVNEMGTPVETKGWAGSDEFKQARVINGYVFNTSSFPITVWSKKKFKGLHSMRKGF